MNLPDLRGEIVMPKDSCLCAAFKSVLHSYSSHAPTRVRVLVLEILFCTPAYVHRPRTLFRI